LFSHIVIHLGSFRLFSTWGLFSLTSTYFMIQCSSLLSNMVDSLSLSISTYTRLCVCVCVCVCVPIEDKITILYRMVKLEWTLEIFLKLL
jgi:hypothetical protein